ncbi:MAG: glycosyltransferase [Nitrospira sp.]|nr:glycosyltransferase [Nitrospira sp.]
MTNSRLLSAVEYSQAKKNQKSVFVIPFPISAEDALALRNHPCCASMILQNPDPLVAAQSHCSWLGCYTDDRMSWRLPENLGMFIFLGPSVMLTRQMLNQVVGTGVRSIVCENNPHHFVDIPLFRFYLWHLAENLIEKMSDLPAGSPVRHFIQAAPKIPGARALWHRVFRRKSHGQNMPLWDVARYPISVAPLDIAFFRELLRQSLLLASRSKFRAEPTRFILVNAGLAAGGAERQIVNTLRGLKSKGFDDICLIGEYLHHSQGLNFYLPLLESAKIAAYPLTSSMKVAEHGFHSVPAQLGELLAKLPSAMAEEILNLAEEFKSRRPAVVHAWQDSTSIKVGIAAVMSGVPRIVLASRNLTPVNFGYYQEYMRYAYQALSELGNIIFLNNSFAGALDYCRWLEIPQDRFQVVKNGVDFSGLTRVDDSVVSAYRHSLGIPKNAPVVGSIFRFWAEKRPMLWLKAAREIARLTPDAHFLLIGEGPMRKEMESLVRRTELENKVHMPGARTDIATPLSSMTVFVLTSEFEGTPNVVLEAQWLGLPVVATDAGGTREAIEEGITGWCCSTPDAAEIAAKTRDVLSDCSLLQQLRQRGPRFVDQQFGMNNMIDRTLSLYGVQNESAPVHIPIGHRVSLTSTQVET